MGLLWHSSMHRNTEHLKCDWCGKVFCIGELGSFTLHGVVRTDRQDLCSQECFDAASVVRAVAQRDP